MKQRLKKANKKAESQTTQCFIVVDKMLIMNGNLIPDMYVMTGSICETALIHIPYHHYVYGKSKTTLKQSLLEHLLCTVLMQSD